MEASTQLRRRSRSRRGTSDVSRGGDLFTGIKVFSILLFLLFVLYMLSFSMNSRGHLPVGDAIPDSLYLQQPSVTILREQDESEREKLTIAPQDLETPTSGEQQSASQVREEGDSDLEALNQKGSELDSILSEGGDAEYGEEFEKDLSKVPFSNTDIPGAKNGVKLIMGNLSNAYRYEKRSGFNTRMDLPRVFPRDLKIFKKNWKNRRTVCVYTRTPRQDSLFRTNLMSMFGSGQYNYVIMRSTQCVHDGVCQSGEEARAHPKCDPNTMPTLHLLERIKNFQHERFAQVLTNGLEYYDVLVSTGDEFCRALGTYGRAHFRTYYGPLVTNSSRQTPIYLPLGPREEFQRVYARDVRLVRERKYTFNFLGSLTSPARKELISVVRSKLTHLPSFLHVVAKWSKKLTAKNGYVNPLQYKQVLLNSVFTLCPQGHNPEAFRIYEACEAGSIPIVVLDHHYRSHECYGSYAPLINQGAPFVFLNSWYELPGFFELILKNPERIQQMQADSMAWYRKFMTKVATQFETVMELRFQDRMDRGDFTSTADLSNLQSYLDDPKYVKPL